MSSAEQGIEASQQTARSINSAASTKAGIGAWVSKSGVRAGHHRFAGQYPALLVPKSPNSRKTRHSKRRSGILARQGKGPTMAQKKKGQPKMSPFPMVDAGSCTPGCSVSDVNATACNIVACGPVTNRLLRQSSLLVFSKVAARELEMKGYLAFSLKFENFGNFEQQNNFEKKNNPTAEIGPSAQQFCNSPKKRRSECQPRHAWI